MGRRVRRLAQLVAARLPQGAHVLDVGSGSGEIAAEVLRQRPDLRIEGIDVLVRPVTHIPVRQYDGIRMPFPDGSFDACLFVDVLHHCGDPVQVLAEARRVARGTVVVKDHFSRSGFDHATLQFMDWIGNWSHHVDLPFHYFRPEDWARRLAQVGLREKERATSLHLYAQPLDLVFGRGLHFVSVLEPEAPALQNGQP
jgi:SAM-dependent methyltransferase